MIKENLSKISINCNDTIFNALNKLNKSKYQCLFVIDYKKTYLGTLTDGDIRRYLVKNKNLQNKIKKIFNKKSVYFNAKDNLNREKIFKTFDNRKIKLIAILDENKKIINFYDQSHIKYETTSKKINLSSKLEVIIMAGGSGKRMKPFTDIFPKCLLPINGKVMIDTIINKFDEVGLRNIYLSINYKKELIKSYLSKNKNITFIEERKKLGTFGSASLIPKKNIDENKSVFISNCDTIFDVDLNDLYKYHSTNKFDLTIVGCNKKQEISYGILEKDKHNKLVKINEKPSKFFLVNTGLYILQMKLLKYLKRNERIDMDKFIEKLLDQNKSVGIYQINSDKWLDIGVWPEYLKTKNIFEKI